ncbi:MAG: 2-oxoglutarate ferredoxin oxidoreductase subunit alpha, partial [Bacteroidetes bacterium]|nr:2-oxoglutarate ferredoxin oxidoreductase subunit alpha [Bacteroidota bacterium]
VADYIPLQDIDNGVENGKVVFVTWGSTYGTIKTAVYEAREEGLDVSHIHIKYLAPFPKNLESLLKGYDKVIVPELNNGQLVRLIRDQFLIPAEGFNKIKGLPFTVGEVKQKINSILKG